MKKAISYMACSMAAMLALSACGSAASSASTVASSSDAASTESTAASEASNEPVTITFAQYSGSGDNEQYLQQMVDNYMKENPNVTIQKTFCYAGICGLYLQQLLRVCSLHGSAASVCRDGCICTDKNSVQGT